MHAQIFMHALNSYSKMWFQNESFHGSLFGWMVIVTTYYLFSIKAIGWMLSEVWIFKEVAQLQVGFKPSMK